MFKLLKRRLRPRSDVRPSRPTVEQLEDRLTPSTLIPVRDHRDLVFDGKRDLLYITTATGLVQRFDVARRELLTAWNVGTSLNGADITPDGAALYVAENQGDLANRLGFLHKVDLATGAVTDLNFSLAGEIGAWDVLVGPGGKGLFTTYDQGFTTFVPLHGIDLSTDALFTRPDTGLVGSRTLLARSLDYQVGLVAGITSGGEAFFRYDAAADGFSPSVTAGGTTFPAVSRDGSLFAFRMSFPNHVVSVLDRGFRNIQVLPDVDGGLAFDPLQDVLYVANPRTSQIIAYDTNTWRPKYRLDIGESITGPLLEASAFGNGEMTVSPDGRFLFLATASGVRLIDLPAATGEPAILNVSGFPSLLRAGAPGSFTVTATDPAGNPAAGYTGTIHLRGSGPDDQILDAATGERLRGNKYTFQPEDQGARTFTAILSVPGTHALTARDQRVHALTGTQAGITVHDGRLARVPLAGVRDLVFDPHRNLLYAATSAGTIERFDLARQALLEPIQAGASLNGADITPDGRFLYAADTYPGASEGFIRKIDLDTGTVTNFTYDTAGMTGSHDVTVGPAGKALFTTRNPGGGGLPLFQIDVAGDTVTRHAIVNPGTPIFRGADRSLFLLVNAHSTAADVRPYDAITECFLPDFRIGSGLFSTPFAINRNGSLIAVTVPNGSHVVSVFDTNLRVVQNLADADGGMVFDPVRDVLYVASAGARQIVAYDTNSWRRQYALDLGEAIGAARSFGNGVMAVSGDGRTLFLTTALGIRIYDLPPSTGRASALGVTSFPRLITAGDAGSFTVTARDPIGNVAAGYAGTVQLSSSDPAAIFLDPVTGKAIPIGVYTFQASDRGVRRFQAILHTPGPQSLSATDSTQGLLGTQPGIVVHAVPVTLVPVPNHRGLMFDPHRNLLYVTTSAGTIERYDIVRQALLEPFRAGTSLAGADLTPDGRFLYVADRDAGATQGFIRKVDLDTGAVTSTPFNVAAGSWGVTVAANGKPFFTTGAYIVSTAALPFYQIDPGSGALTAQRTINQFAFVSRSADRRLSFFGETYSSAGHIFTYDAATDTFSSEVGLFDFTSVSAVNRDGSLIAVVVRNNTLIFDRSLRPVRTLTGLNGGVAFDPRRDLLYAVNPATGQIIAHDTTTWAPQFSLNAGETIPVAAIFGNGMMTVSDDGSLLFLATPLGVRVYPLNDLTQAATVLSASPAGSALTGQPVTLTAAVTGGTPAEREGQAVTFLDGDTVLGTALLDASGQAVFTTSALAAGSRVLSAVYAGDPRYNFSGASIRYSVQLPKVPTVLTVTADPDGSSYFRQEVTFRVTVGGGDPADRAGQFVSFTLPVATIGFATLDATGRGSFRTILNLGTNVLTVRYQGDSRHEASSVVLNYLVDFPAQTITGLSASPLVALVGQSVTFTATIFNRQATGEMDTVTFSQGGIVLGQSAVSPSGIATFTTSALPVGLHALTAAYSGNSRSLASVGSRTFQVARPNTIAALTRTTGSVAPLGQPLTVLATIRGGNPADREGQLVTFRDGPTVLGTGVLNAAGQASFTTAALGVGGHVLTVVYGGDDNYRGGSASFFLAVVPSPWTITALSLSVSLAFSFFTSAQAVTFTATISSPRLSELIGETITFTDRNLVLGTATITSFLGQTVFTTRLAPGLHTINASFAGNSTNGASRSPGVQVTVVPSRLIPTRVTLQTSAASPVTVGQSVTFTTRVVGIELADIPGQTVTFRDGDMILGTAGLSTAGLATFTTAALGPGTHRILAAYAGDSKYQSGCAELIVVVRPAGTIPTSLSLETDLVGPAIVGQAVTFTATIGGGGPLGQPGQTVVFLDGATVLGTAVIDASGRATLTVSSLVPGDHRISVVYLGDQDSLGSSAALVLTIIE